MHSRVGREGSDVLASKQTNVPRVSFSKGSIYSPRSLYSQGPMSLLIFIPKTLCSQALSSQGPVFPKPYVLRYPVFLGPNGPMTSHAKGPFSRAQCYVWGPFFLGSYFASTNVLMFHILRSLHYQDPILPGPFIPRTLYSEYFILPVPFIPRTSDSQDLLFPGPHIPRTLYSEYPILPVPFIPRSLYSQYILFPGPKTPKTFYS